VSKNDGGPAFPISTPLTIAPKAVGMSLRDYFAGQALAGMDIFETARMDTCKLTRAQAIAKIAYELADAMIAARDTEKPDVPTPVGPLRKES
jgi:hypothetical protein